MCFYISRTILYVWFFELPFVKIHLMSVCVDLPIVFNSPWHFRTIVMEQPFY